MARFAFSPDQRVQLLASVLPAFVAKGFEHLPPRGKPDDSGATPQLKYLPGRFDQCAAAWAQSTVDSLEYRIRSDIEYHEKRAAEASAKAGAS